MKYIIETVANLNEEMQNKFYEELKNNGLTNEDVETIQKHVFTYKLFNDKAFYNAAEETVREAYMASL